MKYFKILELTDLHLKQEDVFRCMGYGKDASPHEETIQRYETLIKRIPETGVVTGAFTDVPVTGINETGVDTPTGFIKSERLAKISEGVTDMVFGLITAGVTFDRMAESFTDMVDAFLWDSIGSALVEEGVTRLLKIIEKEKGRELSLPFSPGYCDWDLTGQNIIFSAFDPSPLGINVSSDSLVMSPVKSVSFVSCMDISGSSHNPCRFCNLKSCFMRRKG